MTMNKEKVCQAFGRAAASYDIFGRFQREVCERMLCLLPERLPAGFRPSKLLDAGCGTGFGTECLKCFWPDAEITGCDLSQDMVEKMHEKGFSAVKGDLENLPFDSGRFDFVWCSLALQWCDPAIVFPELHRVLENNGLLYFTTPVPGTLAEIDFAFSGVDDSNRVLPFHTPEELGNHLRHAGFADIELHTEKHVMYYPDFRSVIDSIRGVGAHQSVTKRQPLMGKTAWKTAAERYESYRDVSGLPVTYELVYGFAVAKK